MFEPRTLLMLYGFMAYEDILKFNALDFWRTDMFICRADIAAKCLNMLSVFKGKILQNFLVMHAGKSKRS